MRAWSVWTVACTERVFRGESNPDPADPGQEWPDAHVGDTSEGVNAWVESMAIQLGYSRVDWDAQT